MGRKVGAYRSGLVSGGVFGVMGGEEGGIAPSEIGVPAILSAGPDLLLPVGVVALDFILKALFAWRRKDRRDAQAKAEMDEAAKMRPMAVGALENGVVVELRVARQAPSLPVRVERVAGGRNGGASG